MSSINKSASKDSISHGRTFHKTVIKTFVRSVILQFQKQIFIEAISNIAVEDI